MIQERLEEYKRLHTIGKVMGVESHVLSPQESKELYPLMNVDDVYGTLYSPRSAQLKVIRKFFFKNNIKSFRWHLGDYEKHIFFHLKAFERRNFDFCVFLRMCSGSVKNRFI